jgi:hypothetical protein
MRTYLNLMKKKHLWVCLSKPNIVLSHVFMLYGSFRIQSCKLF